MKTNRLFSKFLLSISIGLFLYHGNTCAQQAPTGSPGNSPDWHRGGNTTSPNTNNILGTTWNSPIYFYTNGVSRMTLLGNIAPVPGALGIGTSTPKYLLDVNGGDINVATGNRGYIIGGNGTSPTPYVLWNNGIFNNIFVGVGAGSAFVTSGDNTFVGNNAGTSTTGGFSNTFTGSGAGQHNENGFYNTFTGYQAGFFNANAATTGSQGSYNTFTGIQCGYGNTLGDHNEAYGKKCLLNNQLSRYNTCYGSHNSEQHKNGDSNACFGTFSWLNNVNGIQNVVIGAMAGTNSGITAYDKMDVMLGARAGYNNPSGNYNIMIGAEADAYTLPNYNPINNAVAIGASTLALNNNTFILGNNNHLVGIGESNDPLGPQSNLEIRTDQNLAPIVGPYPTVNGYLGLGMATTHNPYFNGTTGTGFSGLKFRDLTAFSTPADMSLIASKSGAAPTKYVL